MNKLTLVLTSYNRLLFLKEMVESLEKQSDLDFDLIICDNHSTDGSWSYIDSLNKLNNGEYIKLHWDENKGWAGSAEKWNKFIKTEWATILCDDDWLGVDFVKTINTAINNLPYSFSGLIVIGHQRVNKEKKIKRDYLYKSKIFDIETAVSEFYYQRFDVAGISGFALPSKILKTDFPKCYEGNGFMEDTLIIYRTLLSGGLTFSDGIHYYRREHSDNISAPNKGNLFYRISMLRFKNDIITYTKQANCSEKLKKKIIRYNIIDHLKGIIKEVVIQERSIYVYNDYVRRIRKIDRIKYIQSVCIYPIIISAVFLRKIL